MSEEAAPQMPGAVPACRHFGACGGCTLQHVEQAAYRAGKRRRVEEALARAGLNVPVGELVACPPGSRRRVALSARRTAGGVLLGYRRASSHEIIDIEECPVARPRIVAALPDLKRLAGMVAGREVVRVGVTETASGLDVALAEGERPDEAGRRRLVATALELGLARLSLDGEVLVAARPPQIMFGTAAVTLPPGAFLQAVAETEAAMAALVGNHLARARHIADLFCGSGTFALRLAAHAEVHAVEAEAAPLAALEAAFRNTQGLRRVKVERRDLSRRPLTVKELAAFDGLVFDPPRAGAEEQARQIARSDVPLVAAVSCNPATLARDVKILADGGYAIRSVTPLDQFLWSAHVEAVALLEKPRTKRRPIFGR